MVAEGGTAGMEKTARPDFLEAIGQDMLEEPPDKLQGVEAEEAWAGTVHFAEVKVTVRSVRRTRRGLERATLKTEGAREVKAECLW